MGALRTPIAAKLGIGFGVCVIIVAAQTVVATLSMRASQERTDAIVKAIPSTREVRDTMLQVGALESAIRGYAATGDKSLLASTDEAHTRLDEDVTALKIYGANHPQFAAFITDAEPKIEAINATIDRLSALLAQGKRSEAVRGLKPLHEQVVAFDQLGADIDDGSIGTPKVYKMLLADLVALQHTAMTAYLAVGIFAALVCAIAAWVLSASLSRRIGHVSGVLRTLVEEDFARLGAAFNDLAAGQLGKDVRVAPPPLVESGSDEIGALADAYRRLADGFVAIAGEYNVATQRLRTALTSVSDTGRMIAGAASEVATATAQSSVAVEQISHAMERVAEGARTTAGAGRTAVDGARRMNEAADRITAGSTEQARAVATSSQAMERLAVEFGDLTGIGESLAKAAADADREAAKGVAAVRSTEGAMSRVRGEAAGAAAAVASLEQRSAAVEQILDAIGGIADQTNLLALNAAIEAARAGEHGRGFAVVADEIRKLADASASQTREIAVILGAIRDETKQVAKAMAASTGATDDGLELAARATAALAELQGAIVRTREVADDVAARAERMRTTTGALRGALGSVTKIVDENRGAADVMRDVVDGVVATLDPVAVAAEEQTATAEEVAASTFEVAAQVQQIDATAALLREHAERLREAVDVFRFAETANVLTVPVEAADELPALAGEPVVAFA